MFKMCVLMAAGCLLKTFIHHAVWLPGSIKRVLHCSALFKSNSWRNIYYLCWLKYISSIIYSNIPTETSRSLLQCLTQMINYFETGYIWWDGHVAWTDWIRDFDNNLHNQFCLRHLGTVVAVKSYLETLDSLQSSSILTSIPNTVK